MSSKINEEDALDSRVMVQRDHESGVCSLFRLFLSDKANKGRDEGKGEQRRWFG